MQFRASLSLICCILLVFSLPLNSYALIKIPSPVMLVPQPESQVYDEYQKFLRAFNRRFCTQETQATFDQLSRRSRSVKSYIPEAYEGGVDIKTIEKGLKELDKKWTWLISIREQLRAQKTWPQRNQIFRPAQDLIDSLLKLKERHFLKGEDTRALKKESETQLKKLKNEFEKLITELYFLAPFDYPVDHLKQRQLYDANNIRTSKVQTEKANLIMFVRKLQEGGTFDADQKNSDLYLRTTLNTLSLALEDKGPWLSENIRHDLEWALNEMRKHLGWGRERQIARIQVWINRLHEQREFYRKLLNEKEGEEERREFITTREAGKQLKNFVYEKNAVVYKSLLNESELTQALYVFDQILLHEVGNATIGNYRDREDVAQVVVNSRFHPEMSVLGKRSELRKYLADMDVPNKVMDEPSWLNVMFKELRFSFTLYYIPAVRHVFCPDFFRTAETTRGKNLHLIAKVLREPRQDFKALRYFSRWSMVGRYDMGKVWKDFKPIPERVGLRHTNDLSLKRAIVAGKYRYLYTFPDMNSIKHHAIEIGGKTYAMRGSLTKPDFYAYRDPHKFRFFEELH